MFENGHVEQLQPLVGTPTQIVPNHNNNRLSTNSTERHSSVTTSTPTTNNVENNFPKNDVVISVRNAHKSFGKVTPIFLCMWTHFYGLYFNFIMIQNMFILTMLW